MDENAGYPPELVADVLKGLRADLVRDGCLGAVEAGPTVEEPGVLTVAARGGEYKDVLDRVAGEVLDGAGVARAREEDMQYMRALGVYEHATGLHAREVSGRPPVGVDWVDVNKGDGD